MQEVSFKIENFEGPLDLLLSLVSKHKLELWQVNLYEIIDQYLEVIGSLDAQKLDPASEFITMAARLVYMKSLSLLPRQEESEQLENELTGQLIEYQLCKKMAQRLSDMSEGITFFVREPLEIELPNDYNISHDPSQLLAAYLSVMGKGARRREDPAEDFEEIVAAPVVSVQSRIVFILRSMRRGRADKVQELFSDIKSRSEAVATFLGVLELIRAGRITVADDGSLGEGTRKRKDRQEDENR